MTIGITLKEVMDATEKVLAKKATFITEKEAASVIKTIQDILDVYIVTNKIKSLIIGVSGGIDSALCCAIAEPVCRHLGIPLIGRSLPIETNTDEEQKRAIATGEAFCTDFRENTDLLATFFNVEMDVTEKHMDGVEEKIRRGNIKARLRMIYLYNLAYTNKGMVLGTDNYTEYLLGFWTLHGDVGDFGMIQNLWKTEVYTLSKYLLNDYSSGCNQDFKKAEAMRLCIDAVPTDGLGITNSDLEQLGAKTYEEVDEILSDYTHGREVDEDHSVIRRHLKSEFKRNNPYNISRRKLIKEEIE